MKKSLIAIALAATTTVAAAGDWFFVGDSADGERLMGRTGSLQVSVNNHNIEVAGGIFRSASSASNIYAVIATESCADGYGQISLIDENDNKGSYVWATGGNKMYDAVALTICAAYQARHNVDNRDPAVQM